MENGQINDKIYNLLIKLLLKTSRHERKLAQQ